jgi:hypothetical protein
MSVHILLILGTTSHPLLNERFWPISACHDWQRTTVDSTDREVVQGGKSEKYRLALGI